MSRTGPAAVALALALALPQAVALPGCVEWLEVDDPDAEIARPQVHVVMTAPALLPDMAARADGRGPLVPGTPGLRVPRGYFARARLHLADLLMPYCWASFVRGHGTLTFRLQAIGGPMTQTGPGEGAPPLPVLRGVIELAVPPGTEVDDLAGLTLGVESLRGATVSLRLSERDRYLLEVDRLSIEAIGRTAVLGSLQGRARRGAKSQTTLPIELGFVALKAPELDVK